MAYIGQVPEGEAEGLLRKIYGEAVARAGRVWNILKLQSQNPETLAASLGLYFATMLRHSALRRRVRETLAVVVSRANHCHY